MEMIGFGIAGNGQTCQDAISLSIYRSLRVDDKHSGFLTRVGVIQYYVVYFDEKSKLQQKKDCYYWKCERVLMFFLAPKDRIKHPSHVADLEVAFFHCKCCPKQAR